jgi:hypothetical protein
MLTADAIVAVASTVVWLGALTAIALRVYATYRRLPDRFPMHLAWNGELDGIGPRGRLLQLSFLPAIFIPVLAIVLTEDTSVWARATGWRGDVLVGLATVALILLAITSVLTLVNTLAVTQSALGRSLTQRQLQAYTWTMRVTSFAGIGIAALIGGMAWETYKLGP